MPYILKGEPTYNPSYEYVDQTYPEYEAKYPEGLDLRPTSEFHNELRSKIWNRAIQARREISKRFTNWRTIDRSLTIYVTPEVNDDIEKRNDRVIDDTEPERNKVIVFPYSYAEMEALLTYLTAALLKDPIFPYEGVEDSDSIGAALMELVVRNQCIKNKVALNIHTSFRDSLAYGVGIAGTSWERRWGKKAVRSQGMTESFDGMRGFNNVSMQDALLFEGNALFNIDPYMWLPDPSVSSIGIQKGEFQGWIDRTNNYLNLLSMEAEKGSTYFNVKYLKYKQNKRSILALDQSDRKKRDGTPTDLHRSMNYITHPIDIIKLYVNLIPSEWGLGDREYPEKWYFELASDDVIIRAEKADYAHGNYPVAVASPEFDGYNILPIGRMEVLNGLQHTIDFLFNSHVANVRKAVNDMLIVDPYLVNMKDLEDPKPGKLVRLRRPAWGRGVDKVVQQLNVSDITRANIGDINFLVQFMDRLGGADSQMSGMLRQGGPERLTGAEFQGTRSSSMARLQRIAQVIGTQFLYDIGYMFAMNVQEQMRNETYVKVTGRHAEKLASIYGMDAKARVTPYDLAVDYDLLPPDGMIPGGNFDVNFWSSNFKVLASQPELYQTFDLARIFMHMAQESGVKNAQDFIRKTPVQTMPDQKVEAQVQQGNLVPVNL